MDVPQNINMERNLRSEIDNLKNEIASLQKKNEEIIEQHQTQTRNIREHYNMEVSKLNSVRAKHDVSKKEIETAKEREYYANEEIDRLNNDIKYLSERERKHLQTIENLRNDIVELRQKVDAHESENSSLRIKDSQLESNVQEVMAKNLGLQKSLSAMDRERNDLQMKNNNLEQRVQDFGVRISELEKDAEKHQEKMKLVNQQLDIAQREQNKAKDKIQEMHNENEALRQKWSMVDGELTDVAKSNKQDQIMLRQYINDNDHLKRDMRNQSQKLSHSERENKFLEDQIRSLKNQLHQMNGEKNDAIRQRDRSRNEHMKLKFDHEGLLVEMDSMKQTIKDLRNKIHGKADDYKHKSNQVLAKVNHPASATGFNNVKPYKTRSPFAADDSPRHARGRPKKAYNNNSTPSTPGGYVPSTEEIKKMKKMVNYYDRKASSRYGDDVMSPTTPKNYRSTRRDSVQSQYSEPEYRNYTPHYDDEHSHPSSIVEYKSTKSSKPPNPKTLSVDQSLDDQGINSKYSKRLSRDNTPQTPKDPPNLRQNSRRLDPSLFASQQPSPQKPNQAPPSSPPRQQQQEPSSSSPHHAPFATEEVEKQQIQDTAALDKEFMELSLEQSRLNGEYQKVSNAKRSISNRKRKMELEKRLEWISARKTKIRLKLKEMDAF